MALNTLHQVLPICDTTCDVIWHSEVMLHSGAAYDAIQEVPYRPQYGITMAIHKHALNFITKDLTCLGLFSMATHNHNLHPKHTFIVHFIDL